MPPTSQCAHPGEAAPEFETFIRDLSALLDGAPSEPAQVSPHLDAGPRVGPGPSTPSPPKGKVGGLAAMALLTAVVVGAGSYSVTRPSPQLAPVAVDTEPLTIAPPAIEPAAPPPATSSPADAETTGTGLGATGSQAAALVQETIRLSRTAGQTFTDTLKDGSPCPFCPRDGGGPSGVVHHGLAAG